MNEAIRLLARMALRHEDELSQNRVEREFVLTMEVHGGGVLPTLYQVAQVWREAKEKGQAISSLRMAMFLALLQEWLDRLEEILEKEALEGAIKLGVAQLVPQLELEWLYLLWDQEAKKMVKDPKRGPVNHKVFMAWLKELQLGIASSQSLLRFHSTRPLAENYQGETVTFLLTLGHRDQFIDRAHQLLTLMSGLGSTKVAAFRIRPARLERQVPATNKGLSKAPSQAAAHQGGGGGNTAHGVGYGISSWKLSNPNNLCYLNSVVSALLGNFQFSGCDFTVAFGTRRNAFQAILSARVCCVPALFHWHSLLSRWPNLTVQQDAAEFLDFVLRSADPAGYLFSWEARRQQREVFGTRTVTTDSGQGFHPLVIDICSGGLQQCVDDWNMVTSSSIYALRCAPRFLFLQLRRYTQRRGAVLKSGLSVPIHPGETIWMPLWEEGIELRYVPYNISSAIFHLVQLWIQVITGQH